MRRILESVFFTFCLGGICGCSILLDPTDCTTDTDCPSGRCQEGICLQDVPEADAMQSFDMGADRCGDHSGHFLADGSLPDRNNNHDDGHRRRSRGDQPPTCVLEPQPVDSREATLEIQITDLDSELENQTVLVNDMEVILDAEASDLSVSRGRHKRICSVCSYRYADLSRPAHNYFDRTPLG